MAVRWKGLIMAAESARVGKRTLSPEVRAQAFSNKLTNDVLAPLPGTDGRSSWSRRRRDLIKRFSATLGRTANERDKVLISNIAVLVTRIEQLHVKIARGELVNDEALIRPDLRP